MGREKAKLHISTIILFWPELATIVAQTESLVAGRIKGNIWPRSLIGGHPLLLPTEDSQNDDDDLSSMDTSED